jgi:hypothetical protein
MIVLGLIYSCLLHSPKRKEVADVRVRVGLSSLKRLLHQKGVIFTGLEVSFMSVLKLANK